MPVYLFNCDYVLLEVCDFPSDYSAYEYAKKSVRALPEIQVQLLLIE